MINPFKKKSVETKKESCIVAGYMGEVGKAIYDILKDSKQFFVYGYDLKNKDKRFKEIDFRNIGYLHICLPYKDEKTFVKACKELIKKFQPKKTIIHSSVNPGATRAINKLGNSICYSPIRGQHDSLKQDIIAYQKYFSCLPIQDSDEYFNHFTKMGLKPIAYNKPPEELELVKLLDICQYAMLIGWAQEAERILKKYKFKYETCLRDFQAEHQDMYPDKRADIFPGIAGGNCVVQDAELILRIFDSDMLKAFLKSNDLKGREKKE